MGSMQSTKSSYQYHLLSPPPSSTSLTKPLLNYEDKLMDQELEIEATQEKNAALDRAFVDIKSSVSRLQSKISKIESRPPSNAKQDAEIHELKLRVAKQDEEIHQLKLRVAKLELVPSTEIVTLQKEFKEVKHRVGKLENIPSLMKKQEKESENLEKKLVELTTAIDDIKSSIKLSFIMREEVELGDGGFKPENDVLSSNDHHNITNDLMGCIVVLIFLVSILIGLNINV